MRWAMGALAVVVCAACGADDLSLDPRTLEARDLLGVDPAVAARWTESERAAAREVLDPIEDEQGRHAAVVVGEMEASLRAIDARLMQEGEPPVWLGRAARDGELVGVERVQRAGTGTDSAKVLLVGWEEWAGLPLADAEFLVELATAAAPGAAEVQVWPAPQEPFGAVYVADSSRLLVNPVLLAARTPRAAREGISVRAGNPYNWFGSLAECATRERLRCESCLSSRTCVPETDSTDGNFECESLAADGGRGYFLLCANLAAAIGTVSACVEDRGPGCALDTEASSSLGALSANAGLVDDATCRTVVDDCLGDLYGRPDGEFPTPPPADASLPDGGAPDGGGGEAGEPREVVDCGEQSCEFSPQCDESCEGPDCGNAFSCDPSCSDGGGGGGGGDCGGCGGDSGSCDSCDNTCDGCTSSSSSGGGGCDDSCDSNSDTGGSGSSSGDGCGGCDSDSGGGSGGDGSSGGGCGGGGCGSSSSSGGDSGGSSGCGGSSNSNSNCGVSRRRRGLGAPLSVLWALAPLPVIERWRRRARKGVRP